MTDYKAHPRKAESTQHAEVLGEVAFKRVEAGHRRVRAYAMTWGEALPGQLRQQSDELLPGLKEPGIDPTQAYRP
jgi:hypothetical protein